jgi:ferrous iron transport protein B
MSTRSIESWKERMITIMVTPLMSCSARIPVFTVLIALIVPDKKILYFFNIQGLVLMGLYLLGFLTAIASAWILNKWMKGKEKSFFIMEFPVYQLPRLKNVFLTILEKAKTFTFEAGKIIVLISVLLWFLATWGPGDQMNQIEFKYAQKDLSDVSVSTAFQREKLEASYAGHFGKYIEPAIAPLGYDWKIGVALITSFAAREVFIGTMATIYSVGNVDDEFSIRERLAEEKDADGKPYFSIARAGSLLIFYLFAMQCMSTIAVVYRETKGWKWPTLQFIYMTALAYISSGLFFQLFS